ncbi:metal-dependent hydrolase family protein [Flavisphingomonas formosensis]|uniref:metal-dependent hydrolase family protein n=1 Tax=Flavisphingomonas formosensis TaxID=861534 RepID=UPI001E31301E|nr:amidohydrolase family protein [Sphingomonas formosensis]
MILDNCRIFDGVSETVGAGRSIRVEDGLIREIADRPLAGGEDRIDLGGRFVMPGLIDAHVHAYGSDGNLSNIDRTYPALRALQARRILEDMLARGFTTVRDAAGGDIALAIGTEQGLIRGPRFFYPGLAISQTGGHGDPRAPDHYPLCSCAYCGSATMVADGVDEVRRAVREQLRRGAHQIKLFVSGGVLTPSDPLWMNQLSDEEIQAAVAEARSRRVYVMAHAHTNEAALRCLRNGIRSIEHATILEEDGARAIAATGDAFAVPTLVITDVLSRRGPELGLTPAMRAKAAEVARHALASLDLLRTAGARIGFGTDLVGDAMDQQAREFVLRADVCRPIEILRSATSINAALLQMEGRLGVIAPGAFADIIAVDGDPLADIAVLGRPERTPFIMKGGEIFKNLVN